MKPEERPATPPPLCGQLLQALLDFLPQRIFWKDAELRYLGCNAAAAHEAGLQSPAQMVGRTDFELAWKESAEAFRADDRHIFAGKGAHTHFTEPQLRADGSSSQVRTSKLPIPDAAGRIVAVLGISEVVQAREQTERALRESEERFRMAFEYAGTGIALVSLEGRFLQVNAAVSDIVGYSESELLGTTFQAITHPEDLGTELPQLDALLQGQIRSYRMEKRYFHRDGHIVWIVLTAAVVRDAEGAPLYYVAHIEDITARRRAKDELRWKTALLEAQLDSTLDGILVVDEQGKKLLQSAQFAKLWRIPQHITENADDGLTVQYVTQSTRDPERFLAKVRYLYAHPDETSRDEIELVDGRTFDRYSSPVLGKDSSYYGRIWMFRDITARKTAEAEMERMHKQLLEVSREAGMAEVASSVLHNVGNVLNSVNVSCAVIGQKVRQMRIGTVGKSADLLQRHAGDLPGFFAHDPSAQKLPAFLTKLAARLVEEQGEVIGELRHLSENIEHIKEIVAMQQGYANVSPIREILALSSLAEDALRMNDVALRRHDVEVLREYGEAPPVSMEKHKVLQILVNLVRNARDSVVESGRVDPIIALRITAAQSEVHIAVCDNGIGIAAENLTRIFAHGFTTKKDGHGFGLHSAAIAAREMGARFWVESEGGGKGATFHLALPIVPET